MKKTRILTGITLLTIISLTLVRVFVANSLSTTGIELGDIQVRIEEYKKQNNILKVEVLKAASLQNIAKSASLSGFTNAKSFVYVDTNLPIAMKQ
jgi:cell division protein FtsL